MHKHLYILLSLFCLPYTLPAQQLKGITDFIVKENLIKNDKLAIIATDTTEQPDESISGTYQFIINGFKQELTFNEGVAITPNPIEKSTFAFIKHKNSNGSNGKLFFLLKADTGLNPIKINWLLLILIPAGVLLFGYMFKRFFTIAIISVVVMFIFNYNKGLDVSSILETVVHGIKDFLP